MMRNHASGGESVSEARSHGRRHSAAEVRAPTDRLGRSEATAVLTTRVEPARSARDLGPRAGPLLVRDTVALAIAALCERRLPELDGVEVRVGLIGVLRGAPALEQRVHHRAGLGV